ncbi:Cadmium, zinc and cobalt-transporting ATPase [Acholeplasma oculi]|uniref:P-type Zn(2+) transporter n=1 Tax=Acholeplasma oculi TaxID=35623 RepID=A0A061AAK2_9MOLU|nr:heavy metal translocating P-type ATPase [Acholeplasma oculi]CDR30930.1 Heavy metal-transporting P-type ATPase [Acholeplasma oculi]SKC35598.1 Cd2+/Zn2+-exporting ATPase [Acholeplasma oculi]SUT90192.1 Cadmium, zinc and cobalt-transporting ATPase [Acholeplasma oculi]
MKEIKYSLSEISCASCADKIEQKIKKLNGVEEGYLNFVTKEIKVQVADSTDTARLFDTIKKIVKDEEGDVELCELTPNVIYAIDGLDCANCAAKIETQLNKTDGIEEARVDFLSGKLILSLSSLADKNEVLQKTQKIIDKIEPGVKIHEMSKEDHDDDHDHNHGEGVNLKEMLRLIVGILIFIGVLFVNKESIFYLPMFIVSYILIGGEVVYRAFRNILRGKVFDENFLMTIATIGAFTIGEYPEAVAVMLFYQVGELFQDLAVNRSRRSIKKLMSIRPDVANVKKGDEVLEIKVEEVNVDDIIVIKPGERVPLDGIIMDGDSSLDTKALTGESVPMNVTVGEQVLSGCININGLLTVKVTKLASESTVAKILELVETATSKKAPTEKFITKFARVYTPIVTIAAVLLAVIPPLFIQGATFEEWLYRALIFLVISCPCALVVSIPLGFFGGIGAASKNGILVKGGNYLEALNDIEIAVFDKTGTLTEGSFKVTQVNTVNNISKDELLEKTAYVESFSNHPIALSVVKEYNKRINQKIVSDVKEISGHGIKAKVNTDEVLVGNARLMNRENISFEESSALGSILYIAINSKYAGNIVVSDQIKKDSKEAIKLLKALGVKRTVMLTGDKRAVATSVGKELGLDEVHAELLPEDKLNKVEELLKHKSKRGKLFFVGDGINDTPVLARADIGIAMGGLGADAAIDVADVVIMTDEPSKIATAVKVAKRTRKIVWQNIIFALGVKAFFLILGAFGIATMWEAVIADVGVSLIAILNAMRVLKYKG